MSGAAAHPDFFISRTGADNFENADFMRMMEKGFEEAAKLIVLLSDKYQKSEHCRKEYNTYLASDPGNLNKRVFVFRVCDCVPIGMLATLAYTDLVPVLSDYKSLRQAVREALGIDKRTPGGILHVRASKSGTRTFAR